MSFGTNRMVADTPFFVGEHLDPESIRRDRTGVLEELWSVRGKVNYDNGRRPFFRRSDGTYADVDPVDAAAHHVLVRRHGAIVGCARLLPLTNVRLSKVVRLIGMPAFEAILERLRVTAAETCEGGRWTVVPECRRYGLAREIVLLSWYVARTLGIKGAFLLAGTRDSQDQALCRLGARPIEDCPLIPAPQYLDDLRLLYLDYTNPSDTMQRRIHDSAVRLSLHVEAANAA